MAWWQRIDCMMLHCMTAHFLSVRWMKTSHCMTLHCMTLNCELTVHFIMLHCVAPHHISYMHNPYKYINIYILTVVLFFPLGWRSSPAAHLYLFLSVAVACVVGSRTLCIPSSTDGLEWLDLETTRQRF
jgi:hypothetical protein